MTSRQKIKRALDKAGTIHISGRVLSEDAPKVNKLVAKAQPKVDRVRG